MDTGGVRPDAPIIVAIDAPPVLADTPPVRVDAPPPRPDTGSSRVCVSTCTTDSQCATSCPANPLGANCCSMGRCYMAMVAVCPVGPGTDSGTTMY